MPASALHPTAESLLRAGLDIAEEASLGAMSVDKVVARAGVAKGTFYVHFADRASYLLALHRQFHDELEARVIEALRGATSARERLVRGVEAYLDGCLNGRAVKALLLEARTEPLVAAEVARRNARFSALAATSFGALQWPAPAAAARLFVAMAA